MSCLPRDARIHQGCRRGGAHSFQAVEMYSTKRCGAGPLVLERCSPKLGPVQPSLQELVHRTLHWSIADCCNVLTNVAGAASTARASAMYSMPRLENLSPTYLTSEKPVLLMDTLVHTGDSAVSCGPTTDIATCEQTHRG